METSSTRSSINPNSMEDQTLRSAVSVQDVFNCDIRSENAYLDCGEARHFVTVFGGGQDSAPDFYVVN